MATAIVISAAAVGGPVHTAGAGAPDPRAPERRGPAVAFHSVTLLPPEAGAKATMVIDVTDLRVKPRRAGALVAFHPNAQPIVVTVAEPAIAYEAVDDFLHADFTSIR